MKPDFKLFISNTCEAMPLKVWGKMISSQTSMASPFLHHNKDNYRLVWIWKIYHTLSYIGASGKGSNKKCHQIKRTMKGEWQCSLLSKHQFRLENPRGRPHKGQIWGELERERWMFCGIVTLKANQTQHSLCWLFPFTLQAYLPLPSTLPGALGPQWLTPASTCAPHLLSGFPLRWKTSIRGIGRMEDKDKGESHF